MKVQGLLRAESGNLEFTMAIVFMGLPQTISRSLAWELNILGCLACNLIVKRRGRHWVTTPRPLCEMSRGPAFPTFSDASVLSKSVFEHELHIDEFDAKLRKDLL